MPRIADYIEQNRDTLVRRYAEAVTRVPAGAHLSDFEKIDSLHEFLTTLANISRTGMRLQPDLTARRLEELHISLRLRLGFKQDEVVQEYVTLGRFIAELWQDRPQAEQPDAADVRLLFDELQAAMDVAVAAFTGYSFEEHQAEKRYLHRLDRAAVSLMGELDHALVIRDRLRPLVEVIQEAMQADGAALFLTDGSGRCLLPACTTGLAAESPEPIRAETLSFVAQAAVADDTLYLPDADQPEAPVSEPLRNSGLRSLLALRLYPHGKTLGVLYVGVDRIRLFEPRARRYFQTLIDHLAGLVERAA